MRRLSDIRVLVFGGLVALAGCSSVASDGSGQQQVSVAAAANCTLTQGYWKTHESAWPVGSLTLGTVSYSEAQLLTILDASVQGNGLISLAHQLIAAKLNVAAGADPSAASAAIASADTLIGGLVVPPVGSDTLKTSATAALVATLDSYNTGTIGPGHCGDTPPPPPPPVCGNGVVETGEQCDDGNTVSGDGCSATCTIEPPPPPPPVCGNGVVEAGEECDDGNTVSGDGCSCTCTLETPPPVCGNGVVEAGEECDDGNTTSGDGCSCTCTIEHVCQ